MAIALKTGFSDGITIRDGYVVRFRATSPADGSDVSGVTITNISLFADTGGELDLAAIQPLFFMAGVPDTTG